MNPDTSGVTLSSFGVFGLSSNFIFNALVWRKQLAGDKDDLLLGEGRNLPSLGLTIILYLSCGVASLNSIGSFFFESFNTLMFSSVNGFF